MHLYQKGVFGLCLILCLLDIVFGIPAVNSISTQFRTLNFSPEDPFTMVNDNRFTSIERKINKLSESLANRKTQLYLLKTQSNSNIFSSIRPKIGKTFHYEHLELQKQKTLESSQRDLIRGRTRQDSEGFQRFLPVTTIKPQYN